MSELGPYVRRYVWSVLLYGIEAWTLRITTMLHLETFLVWTLRRTLRTSSLHRVSNCQFLRRAGAQRKLVNTIRSRKIVYLFHILRDQKYCLLQFTLEGRIKGHRGIGMNSSPG